MSSNKRRNLDRLEHWDMIKRIKLTKSKYWILHWDGVTPSTRIIWKGDWRASCRKGSRDAVDSRLTGNQLLFLEAKRANCILRGIRASPASQNRSQWKVRKDVIREEFVGIKRTVQNVDLYLCEVQEQGFNFYQQNVVVIGPQNLVMFTSDTTISYLHDLLLDSFIGNLYNIVD
ncbi:hypothetical protein TURU_138456 [Turdus rufiventris]|nr:hypothetical protein TURU_138456 [Turdus rufiventris]